MEVIQKLSGKSYGGVKCHKIEVVEAAGVDVMDDATNGYVQSITLLAGYNWQEIHGRRNTLHHTENEQVTAGVKVYGAQVLMQIARDHYETTNKLQRMGRIGMLLRWTDNNGNTKLMGSKEVPARMSWGRDNKKARTDANEMVCTFTCTDRRPVVATQP